MTYGNYPDLSQVRRALVIKMRHHGDVLLTSPIFTLLKKNLPDVQIDAFIYQDTLPMLEGHPAISQFILYDRGVKKLPLWKRLWKEAQLLLRIKRGKYDLVLNLTEGDRGAIAALVSGARFRVGFDPQGKGMKGKKKIYTHIVKPCPSERHTVERQIDVLRKIGIFPAPAERSLFLHVPESAQKSVQELLQKEGLKEGGYFLLHPVSRWKFKCPPATFIAELITELNRRNKRIVLSSGPDLEEKKMIDEIIRFVPQVNIVNFAGKLTLKELSALIAKSECLICVDSVPLHIASALKAPVVALFGPTSEQNWGPWMHRESRVVTKQTSCRPCFLDGCGGSKKSDCLFTLPVKDVLSAIEDLSL